MLAAFGVTTVQVPPTARIYAMASVPDEVIESVRVDGCPEGRLFARIACR